MSEQKNKSFKLMVKEKYSENQRQSDNNCSPGIHSVKPWIIKVAKLLKLIFRSVSIKALADGIIRILRFISEENADFLTEELGERYYNDFPFYEREIVDAWYLFQVVGSVIFYGWELIRSSPIFEAFTRTVRSLSELLRKAGIIDIVE